MKRTRLISFLQMSLLGAGYASCLLEWLWLAAILIPPLLENGTLDALFVTTAPMQPVAAAPIEVPPAVWLAAGIITIAILVVSVFVLIRIPRVIVHSGEQLVRQATNATIPILTHGKKIPVRQRAALSRRVRAAIFIVIVLVPILVALQLPAYKEISQSIIVAITLWLGVVSALSFALSELFAVKSTSRIRSRASRE